ncbi:AfsR/SARP family transcriptional regulator [Streptomyces yaizuensis]|uniref:Winged helix-turn-helix domain-containing protein n=1 Tax=Streptomyces yaizuensis TaxID=2989713 RepID=A0ABQ5P2J7_9ACTN|nr:AfsR/SARP family transcriptional regulator [Streptomyces sp. YSPA8]GLF96824.1 winged helix-turn-helix domain-containing protein [Streptomyces sp. YSPA8]
MRGSGDAHDGLRFRLLGSVHGERDGRPLALGAPQQRALLAVLLLRGNRPVSTAELLDALWGERLPDRAVGTLRTYVSRLRRLLEPDRPARSAATVLVSTDDGYLLRVSPGALDSAEFERRTTQAGRLRTAGDTTGAHRELDAALALWSGTPLTGLPGPHAERQRDRLTELWLTAREEYFHCSLALERHTTTIPHLRAFAAEHPLRERTQALLMQALHRDGRQAEAFRVYEETSRALAEEIGVGPGRELSALHTRLRGTPPGAPTRGRTPRTRAAGAPAAPADTLDRLLAETRTALTRLRPDLVPAPPRPVPAPPPPPTALPDDFQRRIAAAVAAALDGLPGSRTGRPTSGRAPAALGTAADLLTAWARLVRGTTDCHRPTDSAHRLLAAARRHGDTRTAGRALRVLAAAPPAGPDDRARAADRLRRALRHPGTADDPQDLAEGALDLALLLVLTDRPQEALSWSERARDRSTALDAPHHRARALALTVRAHALLADADATQRAAARALDEARDLADPHTLGTVLHHVGCAHLALGDAGRAVAHLREARHHHRRTGQPRWEAHAWARLAEGALAQRHPEEAAACATQALALERTVRDPICRGLALAARGQALHVLGGPGGPGTPAGLDVLDALDGPVAAAAAPESPATAPRALTAGPAPLS